VDPDESPGLPERALLQEFEAITRAGGHGRPDSGSSLQELLAYGFLVVLLLAVYIGWVLASGWVVLNVLGISHVSDSTWYPTVAAAAVIPILALAVPIMLRRLDRITPWIIALGPVIVLAVAFGVLGLR
jgi:hypothetical protein